MRDSLEVAQVGSALERRGQCTRTLAANARVVEAAWGEGGGARKGMEAGRGRKGAMAACAEQGPYPVYI